MRCLLSSDEHVFCLSSFSLRSSRSKGISVQIIHSDCFVLGTFQALAENARNLGLSALRTKLEGMKDANNSALKHLSKEPVFAELLRLVHGAEVHPKLLKLEEILLDHFRRFNHSGKSTRAIVFSHYRDSVQVLFSANTCFSRSGCIDGLPSHMRTYQPLQSPPSLTCLRNNGTCAGWCRRL